MCKKLLITGFDPFGGESINPSWEAVRLLPERIGQYNIEKLQIPTVFQKAANIVIEKATEISPDVIICVGQAGGRKGVTPEVIGINLNEASIKDNEGNMPVNVPIVSDGPAAYFSTLPIRDMVKAVNDEGIACTLSYSAGAFVCNDVLYTLLHHYRNSTTRVGFIHAPFLPEQAKEKVPGMTLEDIVRALTAAINVL